MKYWANPLCKKQEMRALRVFKIVRILKKNTKPLGILLTAALLVPSAQMTLAMGLPVSAQETVSAQEPGSVTQLDGETVSIDEQEVSPMNGVVARKVAILNKTVKLNITKKENSASTILYFNTAGKYEIEEESLIPLKNGYMAPAITQKEVSYNGLPGIEITATKTADTAKGTYTYKLIPKEISESETEPYILSTVTFKVQVVTGYPSLTFSPSKVYLNKNIDGDFAYVKLSDPGARFLPLDSATYPSAISNCLGTTLENETMARIELKKRASSGKAYKTTLCIWYGPEWEYKVVKKTITIYTVTSVPKVSFGFQKGSVLDLIRRDSTSANAIAKITATGYKIKELTMTDPIMAERMKITNIVGKYGVIEGVNIQLNKDVFIEPNRSLKIPFTYKLQGEDEDAGAVTGVTYLTVKPTQSTLKLTAETPAKMTLSENGVTAGTVTYSVKGPIGAVLTKDSFKENFSSQIPAGAFTSQTAVNPEGTVANLTIFLHPEAVEPGLLKPGKYTLAYRVQADGSFANKFTTIKITVTVK